MINIVVWIYCKGPMKEPSAAAIVNSTFWNTKNVVVVRKIPVTVFDAL